MSSLGNKACPFSTFVPGLIKPNVVVLSQVVNSSCPAIPIWSYILLAVVFIIGFIRVAIILIDSHKLYNTASNLPLLASSLAKAHGIVSSMYLLVLLTNFHTPSNASWNCILFI